MAKNVLKSYTDPIITNKSMAASFVGTPTSIEFYDNVGIQLTWVGANPIGTIGINISLDYDPRTQSGTWSALQQPTGTPVTIIPTGAAGDGYFDLNQLSGMWIQVTYTTAGGSVGTLTSKIGLKGLQ